jgi:hypothetical protein
MWRVFALAMAGRRDAAERVAAELAATSRSAEPLANYWKRMQQIFGLAPPSQIR